jgi:hypothetical protein
MIKYLTLFLILVSVLPNRPVHANEKDMPRPYEEFYTEIGYKTVEEAVKEFERHFKEELKLPLRVPPITFTHHFGRFNDLAGDNNDSFEMEYINEKIPENHYKINVLPIKYKIPIRDKHVVSTFTLKNGNDATFMTISDHNVLVFESGNWQYMFSVDKNVSDKVTPKILVTIANSIQ